MNILPPNQVKNDIRLIELIIWQLIKNRSLAKNIRLIGYNRK